MTIENNNDFILFLWVEFSVFVVVMCLLTVMKELLLYCCSVEVVQCASFNIFLLPAFFYFQQPNRLFL